MSLDGLSSKIVVMHVIIMLFSPHINLYLDNFKNFRSYTVLKIYPYIAHIYATLMDNDNINEYLKYKECCIKKDKKCSITLSILRYYSRDIKGNHWLFWRSWFAINIVQALKRWFKLIGSHCIHGFTIYFVPRFIDP